MSGLRSLLAADWVRFGHRRDLWIVVIFIPVGMTLLFALAFNGIVSQLQQAGFVDPQAPPEAQAQMLESIRQQALAGLPPFAFPASILQIVSAPVPEILAAVYLAVALVASEFEWGTVQTIHLVSNRTRALTVRIGLVLAVVAGATGVGIVAGALLPFVLSVQGEPLQRYAAPSPDLAAQVALRLLLILPAISLPVLLSVLVRSTGMTMILTLLLFVIDAALTGVPAFRDGILAWVPAVTMTGSASRLVGGQDSALASSIPGWISLIALAAWGTVPLAGAVAIFRRADLTA